MADSSIRLPFSDDPARKVKSLEDNVRAATKQVKEYDAALVKAARTGRELSAEEVRRANEAREQLQSLKTQLNDQKALAAEAEKNKANVEKNTTDLYDVGRKWRQLNRVFGDASIQKLLSGQTINAIDVARTVVHSDRAFRFLGAANLPVKLALEGLNFVHNTYEQKRSDKRYEDEMNIRYLKGLVDEKTFEMYQQASENTLINLIRRTMGQSREREKVEEKAKIAATLDQSLERDIDKGISNEQERYIKSGLIEQAWTTFGNIRWLDPLAKDQPGMRVIDNNGKGLYGSEIKKRINEALEKEMIARRGPLTEEIRKSVIEGVMVELKVNKNVLDAIEQATAKRQLQETLKPDVNKEYWKTHQERMYKLQFEIYAQRVPANPTD